MREYRVPQYDNRQPVLVEPPPQPLPPSPPPRRRFRAWVLIIPIVTLGLVWLIQGLEPAVSWQELMERVGIEDKERYTQLATLGVIVTAIAALYRILASGGDRNA